MNQKVAKLKVDTGKNQIAWFREKFPALNSARPVLNTMYAKGNFDSLQSEFYVGIVGTRKATTYGIKAAHMFAAHIAKRGFCVVSGLAAGIDSAAHKGALSVGGKTIGVSACGIDGVYPTTNRKLFEKMEKLACIISEENGKTDAKKFRFPLRNRIVAAISDLIIVVDAPAKSGALITVRMGLELGKTIAAVPGSIFSYNSVGSNKLIEDGAFPLCSTLQLDYLMEYMLHRQIDENYEQYITLPKGEGEKSSNLGIDVSGLSDEKQIFKGENLKKEMRVDNQLPSLQANKKWEDEKKAKKSKNVVRKLQSDFMETRILKNQNGIFHDINMQDVKQRDRPVSLSEYSSEVILLLRKKTTADVFELAEKVGVSVTDCMDILDELCLEGVVRHEEGDTFRYVR